jgi:hypothetical protein
MVNTGTHIDDLAHHFDQMLHRVMAANVIGIVKVGSGFVTLR